MSQWTRGKGRRLSFGGRVVEDSLAQVGYTYSPAVMLVETALPRWEKTSAVLAQNAWNFVPDDEFEELARPYPASMRRRMRLRRALAHLNTRRAARVVALTGPMADLVARSTGRQVEVSEVLHPLAILDRGEDPGSLPDEPFVLVPGSITWYKAPMAALEELDRRPDLPRRVVLAGSDDGSGCWQEVQRVATGMGIRVSGGEVTPRQMRTCMRRAAAVVIPSRLESLGFSLTEALALSPGPVVCSPLPSHRSLAARVRREPAWLGQAATASSGRGDVAMPEPAELRSTWLALGECLGLPSAEVSS